MREALALARIHGIEGVTVEAAARLSGIAKTTIYRRWPNAAAIVMDAFLDEIGPAIAYDERSGPVAAFRRSAHAFMDILQGQNGPLLRQLVGAAQADAELMRALLERWIMPRRQMGAAVISRAIEAGDLSAETDADILLDAIYGAIYYTLLLPYRALDKAHVDRVIDSVFHPVVVGTSGDRGGAA